MPKPPESELRKRLAALVKRGGLLRGYAYDFIELFAPALTRKLIERALAGEGELYEL